MFILLQAFGFIPDFVGQAKVLLAAKEKGIQTSLDRSLVRLYLNVISAAPMLMQYKSCKVYPNIFIVVFVWILDPCVFLMLEVHNFFFSNFSDHKQFCKQHMMSSLAPSQ